MKKEKKKCKSLRTNSFISPSKLYYGEHVLDNWPVKSLLDTTTEEEK